MLRTTDGEEENVINDPNFFYNTVTFKVIAIKMEPLEFEKSKAMIIVEIVEYVPNSVVVKTIIKKSTGNINAVSVDTGEKLDEKSSPFDNFIQIIDGKAEIIIDGESKFLETGQSIILPAHVRNSFKANDRFKMISTVIKSGYNDVAL